MADTQRTLSALQTLLADNTSGDISPQDLRDMLLSTWYGSWTLNATAKTADFTAVAFNDYHVDLATGTPTNVVCTLPATPSYLDKVRVTISTDDITPSGATVPNKLSWSLNGSNLMSGTDDDPYWLFREGECLELTYYGGAVGWAVTSDGRIAQFCQISTNDGDALTNTEQAVLHDDVDSDAFEMAVVATNHIRVNRPGKYEISCFLGASVVNDLNRAITRPAFDTGGGYSGQFPFTSIHSSYAQNVTAFSRWSYDMGAGDKVQQYARVDSQSTTFLTTASSIPKLVLQELL